MESFYEYISKYVTEERLELFEDILSKRTEHVSVLLEDLYQPHNISAVLRSCDCFGVQNVHIIEKRNSYQVNKDIALGSSQWLSLSKYKETESAILQLKNKGYKMVATTLDNSNCELNDLPIDSPLVLMMGTEKDGLSKEAINLADYRMKIPMRGFTQSFNISVATAICLYDITTKVYQSENIDWKLNEDKKDELKLNWVKNTVKKWELIYKRYKSEISKIVD